MPIFVEHWGGNLQFYPNFAVFSTLARMNLDHDFVQVSKLSEEQNKGLHQKWNTFSPNSGEDQTKKKVFTENGTHFPRIQEDTSAQMHTRVKLLGGMQM